MSNTVVTVFRRSRLGRVLTRRRDGLRFRFARLVHSTVRAADSLGLARTATRELGRLTILPLTAAAIAAAMTSGLPLFLQHLRLDLFAGLLPAIPEKGASAYETTLATVAQGAAAMLALSFTAISVVASTSYAKVSSEIRALIPNDPVNRRYLRLLAHAAATATIGLALRALGVPDAFLLLAYVVVLLCLSLLAFFGIAIRTFQLFEHSALAKTPVREILTAAESIACPARRWRNPFHQRFANRTAAEQLRLLDDLVRFGTSDTAPRAGSLRAIVWWLQAMTRGYCFSKHRIPSNSEWFARRSEFETFSLTSGTSTGIALTTGTLPSPRSVPDSHFVEDRSTDLTVHCLNRLFEQRAESDSCAVLSDVRETVVCLGMTLDIEGAQKLVDSVQAAFLMQLNGEHHQEPWFLQVGDTLAVAMLEAAMRGPDTLKAQGEELVLSAAEDIQRLDPRTVYALPRPRAVLLTIEDLLRRLAFERDVEGRIQPQLWHLRAQIAHAYQEFIASHVMMYPQLLRKHFLRTAHESAAAGATLCAALFAQRGIEACHKAAHRSAELEQLHGRFGAHSMRLEAKPPDATPQREQIEACRRDFIEVLSRLVPTLASTDVPEGVPDFLGQSRAVIGDELVDIMDRRDSARFEPLFRAFSRATMAIHDRLVDRVREGHADPRVLQDLLADMLDLSGLALWYSALDGTPFGGLVEKVWDEILAGLQRKDAYLRYCCQADSTSRLPIMSAGAEQRFRWKRHFESALESRGVREPESVPWLSQAPSVKHTNPVIESLHLHLGMTHAKPRDYFVALYLAKQVADQNQLPRAARDVVMAISRAEARIEGVRRASAER